MSVYQAELPRVFPHQVRCAPTVAREAVGLILAIGRDDVLQGSSFALTVDNWDGTWNLWLSDASYRFLTTSTNLGSKLSYIGGNSNE